MATMQQRMWENLVINALTFQCLYYMPCALRFISMVWNMTDVNRDLHKLKKICKRVFKLGIEG